MMQGKQKFIYYAKNRDIMAKKRNIWLTEVYNLLENRAMSSTEISYKLKERFRNTPHARKVTLVLKGISDDFILLNKVSGQGAFSMRDSNDNYKVALWGLKTKDYDDTYPYNSLE